MPSEGPGQEPRTPGREREVHSSTGGAAGAGGRCAREQPAPRIISVVGLKKSGKTTVVEAIISGLRDRGYRVGAVKSMVHSALDLDVSGKDTHRHRRAGACFVFALSRDQTALLWDTGGRKSLSAIMPHVPEPVDFLVCEGVEDENLGDDVPVVLAAWDPDGVAETLRVRTVSGTLVACSGRLANNLQEFEGLPVLNVRDPEGADSLVELLLRRSAAAYEKGGSQ